MSINQSKDHKVDDDRSYESAFFFDGIHGNAIINKDSHWVVVNNELCRLLCLDKNALDGLKWHNLIDPEHLENDQNIFNLIISGDTPHISFETKIVRLDGVTITVHMSLFKLNIKSSKSHLGMQIRDITSEKLTEETLKKNEITARRSLEELEWIYSNAPIGLCHLDIDMRYKRINKFLADMNNLPVNSHIGKKYSDLVPNSKDSMETIKQELLATGRPYAREFRREMSDSPDKVRYFDEIWYPLYDEYRKIIGFGAVVEEITEKKHVLALKDADRRKNELLATLAHELRNPIGSVSAALELMRMIDENDQSGSNRDRGPLDRAERQIRHMKQLVEDILTVTRINQGKIELRREKCDLVVLVQQAVETINSKLVDKKINFIFETQVKSLLLDLDPLRITQIVLNLLDNAMKFTDTGGKILLSLKIEGKEVVIIIKDDGVGIPPKNLTAIFDIFNQIKTAPEKKNEGIGIGLALVRNLVELHHGKVEARSDGLGKGSTFLIRLPMISN